MIYQTHVPSSPLNEFIAHFTYYKDYTPHHRIDRFLPDGNIEIVIDLTETPKYIYDNFTLKEKQACHKIWISGIRNKFITIPSGRNSEMFVINFRKGMVYPFVNMPLYEITDSVVEENGVLDKEFLQLREKIMHCKCVADMLVLGEKWLLKKYGSSLIVNPFINYAVNTILHAPETTTIRQVADKVGYSGKHFISLFKEQVGITPKAFLRIIRFQKTIEEIALKRQVNWSLLANQCGYYDQSHFIDDFKGFSGFTPLEYVQRRSDYINYVPVA